MTLARRRWPSSCVASSMPEPRSSGAAAAVLPSMSGPSPGLCKLLDVLGLDRFHQQDGNAAALDRGHGAALHPTHEVIAAPVGGADRYFPKATGTPDRLIDRRHQFADRQADIEAQQWLPNRFTGAHAPEFLRLLVPELNAKVLIEDGDARLDVGQNLLH